MRASILTVDYGLTYPLGMRFVVILNLNLAMLTK